MIDFDREAALTLERLLPRLTPYLPDPDERAVFHARLEQHFGAVFHLLHSLYGRRYDFFFHLEQVLITAAQMYTARPADLKALDAAREGAPAWFQSEQVVGGVCYVDRFAGTLGGLLQRLPYIEELGITYLHLMPLFRAPSDQNDDGYAVSSYRDVNPALGTTDELRKVAAALRERNISLVLDFVFNHTSDEHEWAQRALAGDRTYQDYYLMFESEAAFAPFAPHLREIFPEQAPGNLTYRPEIRRWVWTTFHNFQWDLNYANPEVFTAMLGEMLHIANIGVEVLRLDAVAFIWKEPGTTCEGLPQAHTIIRAYNALTRIVAPALLFKSEAIVHPAEVARYIDVEEAPLSYNPTLMALLWESLATRKVDLLRVSMQRRFDLPPGCAWINYVRCHDDIGWTFADEDATGIGISGFDHRQFLNQFYTGAFEGSFARGLPFNYNPITRDLRISGMCASLAGLESALESGNPHYVEHALRRIILIHAVILSAGGIPLIYLGDEIAALNDYSYRADPARAEDSRSVHRPAFDWARAAQRDDPQTAPGRVYQTLHRLIQLRKAHPVFADGETVFFDTGNRHVLGYTRYDRLLALANFSEFPQKLRVPARFACARDLVTGKRLEHASELTLDSYEYLWLLIDDAR